MPSCQPLLVLVLATVAAATLQPTAMREVYDSGVVRVRIPQRLCDPRQHGAIGDGHTDDTVPIQAALDRCGTSGGGTVVLSCQQGEHNCTFAAFPLKINGNHTELRVETSATLKFSSARNDSRWQGVAAALLGSGVHDIAITGGGTIDGNGSLWWTQCAGASVNESGWSTCDRPGLVTMIPVTNLLISGPRFLNSPCHHIVIRKSKHVEVCAPLYDVAECTC